MSISALSFSGLIEGIVSEAALNPNNLLVNGDFELTAPALAKTPASNIIPQTGYAGWNTLESDQMLELWQTGFTPGTPGGITFNSHSGNWLAEINANMASPNSALYQDLTNQVPGTLYQWSFWQSGRSGKDVSMIMLGSSNQLNNVKSLPDYCLQYAQPESTANPVALPTAAAFTNEVKADNLSSLGPRYFMAAPQNTWTNHWGYWTSNSDTVRFLLYSYYSTVPSGTSGKAAIGNLVDDCAIYQVAVPTTQTIEYGDDTGFTNMINDTSGFASLLANTNNVIADSFLGIPDLKNAVLANDPTKTPIDLSTQNAETPNTYLVPVTVKDNTGAVVGMIWSTVIVEGGLTTEYDDIMTGKPIPAAVITDDLGGIVSPVQSPLNIILNEGDTVLLPVFTPDQVITFDGARYRYVMMDTTHEDGQKIQTLPAGIGPEYTSSNPYPFTIDTASVDHIYDYNYMFRRLLPVSGAVSGLPDNGGIVITFSYTDPDTGLTIMDTVTTKADGSYVIPDVPEGATHLNISSSAVTGYNKSPDYAGNTVTRDTDNNSYYFVYTAKQYTVSGNIFFRNQDGTQATVNLPNLNNWVVTYYVYSSAGEAGTLLATGTVPVAANGSYITPAFDYQSEVKVVPTPPTGFKGWAVDVASRTTAPLSANVTGQNFIYKPTITVSGTIYINDASGNPINSIDPSTTATLLQGKVVNFTINTPTGGTIQRSVPVNPDGTYSISDALPGVTIDPGSTVSVLPPTSLTEPYYTINTTSRTLTNVIASVSGVDFSFNPQYVTVSGYLFNRDTGAPLNLAGVTLTCTYTLNGKTYPAMTTNSVLATGAEAGNYGDGRELYSNGQDAITGASAAYTPITGSSNGYYVFTGIPVGADVIITAPVTISDVGGNTVVANITSRSRVNIQANATHCDFIYNYTPPKLSVSGTLYKVDASGNADGVMANTNVTYTIYDPNRDITYSGIIKSAADGSYLIDDAVLQLKYPNTIIPVGCNVTITPVPVSMYHLSAASRSITNLMTSTSNIDFTYIPDPFVTFSGYLYNQDDTGVLTLNNQPVQYSWTYVDNTGHTVTGGGTIPTSLANGSEPGNYGDFSEAYSGSVVGATNGYYMIPNIPAGANVTVSVPSSLTDNNGTTVLPNIGERLRSNIQGDAYHVDFIYTDKPLPVSVAGTVYIDVGDGRGYQVQSGITLHYVILDPISNTTKEGDITTDASGKYLIDDAVYGGVIPPGCTIIITAPNQKDYTISATTRTVAKVNSDVNNMDFYYDPIQRVTFSGYLMDLDQIGILDLSDASVVQIKYSYTYTDSTGEKQTITGSAPIKEATGSEVGENPSIDETAVPVSGSKNGYYEITGIPYGANITVSALLYYKDNLGNYATVDVASRSRVGITANAYHADFLYSYDESTPQIMISGTVYKDDLYMNHVGELDNVTVNYIISDVSNTPIYQGSVVTHFENGHHGYYVIDDSTVIDQSGDPTSRIPAGCNVQIYIDGAYSDATYGSYVISAGSRSFEGVNADLAYVDFEYYPAGASLPVTLSGTLSMQDGSPYDFSKVPIEYVIKDVDGNVIRTGTFTPNADGSYSIGYIPVGSVVTVDPAYSVPQKNSWGQDVERPIDIRARTLVVNADVTDVNFKYTTIVDPTISGTLIFLNDDGNPISSTELAQVLASLPVDQIQYSFDGGKTWVTDNITIDKTTGAYLIEKLPEGVTVQIKVKDVPGYKVDSSTLVVPNLKGDVSNINFTYHSTTEDFTISGKLIIKDHPEYQFDNDEAVTVTYNDNGVPKKFLVLVDKDGSYSFDVPKGCSDVVIKPPQIPGCITPGIIRINGPITKDMKDNNFTYVMPKALIRTTPSTPTNSSSNGNYGNEGGVQAVRKIIQTGDALYLGTFFVSTAVSIMLYVLHWKLKSAYQVKRVRGENEK